MPFLNGGPIVVGQAAEAVLDMQFMLTDHSGARVTQQFVIMEQTSCDSVFDGRHSYHCGVAPDIVIDFLEGGTADDLHLLTLEVQVCGDVVERPYSTLNGYTFHDFKVDELTS